MDNLLRLRYLRHRQTPIYLKLVKAHAIRRELPLQSLIESVNFADFQIARIKKWIFILYVLFIFLSALRQSVLWVIHYIRILLVYSFFAITGQRYCFFVKPPNFSVLFFSQSKEHLCFRRGKQHTCCMPSTYAHVRIWQTQERYQPGKKKENRSLVPGYSPHHQKWRPPTLPHCIAVPSAQAGLTSLFGMGRGGPPPQ